MTNTGLVQNGFTTNGYSNVTVQNINVDSSNNSTLADFGGWIGQQYFGIGSSSNVLINNCSSSGAISGAGAGGICGSSAGAGGEANVSNCYSSGAISGQSAGGICGLNAGYSNGTANVSNCYSSGAISAQDAGGICGGVAGYIGTAAVSNCYSSGAISGYQAGGICGAYSGNTNDSNTYIANGSWTDASAITKLIDTPTYNNGVLVNPMGNVWSDIAPDDDRIPWILSINYVPPAPICFPKGTPVSTDQGDIAIEKLNSGKHTIRGKRIVGITKSRPLQKHIVCIEKDALYENVPSRRTEISKEHKVFYKGKMIKSRELVDLCENVNMIPYNREILYNVVLDSHDKMMINNLVCETLDPDNIMAKIINKNRSSKEVNKIYSKLTKIMINNDIKSFNKMKMSL